MVRRKRPIRRLKTPNKRLARALKRLRDPGSPLPIWVASLAALAVFAILTVLYLTISDLRQGYWPGAYVEATGFFLDLLFFGVALATIIHWRDRRHALQRHQEEIQDFKRWDTEEGRLRIAGAIRRLANMGKADIDFRGIKLSNFSFRQNDIRSIRGSVFYDGEWGTLSSREEVTLKNVDFSFLNCAGVMFSAFNPFGGLGIAPSVTITNCFFCETDLRGAIFNGAAMHWTEPPPDEIYEGVENPDGSLGIVQISHPPFNNADFAGASFKATEFKNADFRNAENLLQADFSQAKGLETCVFDDDSVKSTILKNAAHNP